MTGKLIVIDGTDGAGKATQTALLAERLKREGRNYEMIDFPRYGKASAYFVEQYLNGHYGTLDQVNGYQASLFFALDRYDARARLRSMLDAGSIVLSNRYVTSNMGHQAAKISDPVERMKFLDWLEELEYGILGIPRPDVNIILHVVAATGQRLVDGKGFRSYIGGHKKDLHEADLNHLRLAEQTYLEIARSYPNFEVIECEANGQIMAPERIAELVWQTVEKII